MLSQKAIFSRTERLLGPDCMDLIAGKRVILFGVGGVGSWCAEGLIRSGIRHLAIVDSDCVSVSNINRQRMANVQTVGRVKVEALREQLLLINPEADITALQEIYNEETAPSFHLEEYDYIIDAIDSLKEKALLILNATRTRATFLSSMGAALKMDPTRIQVAEFWKVQGCPLGRALRQRFKRDKVYPRRKFQCVFSDELLQNLGPEQPEETTSGTLQSEGRSDLSCHDWNASKAQINGSLAHITAVFGFMLSGLVLKDIRKNLI